MKHLKKIREMMEKVKQEIEDVSIYINELTEDTCSEDELNLIHLELHKFSKGE